MILEGFQSSQRNYLFKFSGLFSLAPSLNRINRFGSQTEENFSDAGCMEVEVGLPACLPATLSSPPAKCRLPWPNLWTANHSDCPNGVWRAAQTPNRKQNHFESQLERINPHTPEG